MAFPGSRDCADVDAARIAEAAEIPVREDYILVEHERPQRRVVRHERGVTVADADDFVACAEKRGSGSADDGIRAWRAAREEDGDAGRLITPPSRCL